MEIVTNVPEVLYHIEDIDSSKKYKSTDDQKIDLSVLTPAQRIIFDAIIEYLEGKSKYRILVIKGYAGVGKTFILSLAMRYYVLMQQKNIAVTAPTNKAVKVLKQSSAIKHRLIQFKTLHKLFGLKPKVNEKTGKQEFIPEFGVENAIDEITVLAVDETSMCPDELTNLILEKLEKDEAEIKESLESMDDDNKDFDLDDIIKTSKRYQEKNESVLKVLFLGDPLQIPPVGKEDSIPFNPGKAEEYNMGVYELTEIIRQKEGNPIIELSDCMRRYIDHSYVPYKRELQVTEQGSISFIAARDKEVLFKLCELYFCHDNFKNDSDFAKVIAWTNRTVNYMNENIRNFIYRDLLNGLKEQNPEGIIVLPRILHNEKLITNEPVVDTTGFRTFIVFDNNEELEVLDFTIHTEEIAKDAKVKYYLADVKSYDYSNEKWKRSKIKIVHEDSIEAYNNLLQSIHKSALKAPVEARSQLWKFYYSMKEKFADVSYNYAITAHKSQGSTYENAFVITADIDKNSKIVERNKIKYVAFTRARKNLFIIE